MSVECDIVLDSNENCVVRCGEPIYGTLQVKSQSSFVAKGIFVKLRGKGIVSYEDKNGSEQYFSPDEYINSKELSISTGLNEFKFQLSVPDHLPSTFVYAPSIGYILYKLAAYLDNEGSQKKIGNLPVTVQGKLDLRCDPAYRMPISAREEKRFLFSKHGLELLMNIPQTGFAIGQRIPFSLLVRNESTVDCFSSKIYLVQFMDYINNIGASYPCKREHVVQEKPLGAILKHSSKKFDDSIDIPMDVCITTQDRSKIIKIHYKVRFVAIVKGPHLNGKLECPFVIGSIPLDEKCEKY